MFNKVVISCLKHQTFFDETCKICKKEYFVVKGLEEKDGLIIDKNVAQSHEKPTFYKEFTEEKAKHRFNYLLL
jgi:hypothetical protein